MLNWLKKYSKWATYFILGAALIAVYKTFDSISALWSGVIGVCSAFKPFAIAFVAAYLLNIPTKKLKDFLERKIKSDFVVKHANGISVAVTYVVFIFVVIWLIGSIVPALFGDFYDIYQNLPQYAQEITDVANNSEIARKIGFRPQSLDLSKYVSDNLFSSDIMKNGIKAFTSGIWSFASGFMDIFIAMIASVYMLLDKERILRAVYRLVGKLGGVKADLFLKHCSNVNEIFTQYIYSRLTCCVVMAVVCTLILALMGEKYALLLGFFIGFMDLIPYFGSIISWAVGLLVMSVSGGLSHGIWCSAAMLVMQQIDGNILAPKVTGARLEVRPLTIIIAVSVGGSLFGFPGMLLSVPVVVVIRAILTEFIDNMASDINEKEQ